MAMKRMTRSRMASCSVVGALAVALILLTGVGSAVAFPTLGDEVYINSIGPIPGATLGQIPSGTVYMGPYLVNWSPSSLSTTPNFTETMMCFNAGVPAKKGDALATNSAGAIAVFELSGVAYAAQKIDMIAYLASQWVSPSVNGSISINANINKAMWEIWADYDGSSASLNIVANSIGAGSFYLPNASLTDDTQVKSYISAALGELGGELSAANFLIPLTGDNKYDVTKQPFVQPVPEPGTLLLLGSGLVGLGLHGWRKRSKAQR
jgi:hypothetical protein